MSNNKEINNEEAMQDLVDSFTKSILDKGTSDLKDLGIKKLQNFLIYTLLPNIWMSDII